MKKQRFLLGSLLGILFIALPSAVQAQIDIVGVNDGYLAAGLVHQRYTAWNAVRDHEISGSRHVFQNDEYTQYYGQSPCDRVFERMPAVGSKNSKPRNLWSNYVWHDSRYQSAMSGSDWKIGGDGVQIGTDIFRRQNCQFGAFFGYENSAASNAGDRVHANDYYFGLYDVHVFKGGADLRTVFSCGWQDLHTQRNGQGSVYETSFRGLTSELNVELGKRYYFSKCCGGWSARPVVGLDWHFVRLGNGLEIPNNSLYNDFALRYHGTDFAQLFFRFGTDLRYERGRWAVEGGFYYSYDLRGASLWSEVSDALTGNRFQSALISSNLGRSLFSVNVAGALQVTRNVSAFAGYRGEASPEQAGRGFAHAVYAGGAWRW